MYLLYCDESNLESRSGDFFVYGGLVIDSEAALGLSTDIDNLRKAAGIPKDFCLKFKPQPENLSHEDFSALKQSIIEAAVARDCIFLTSLILHDIATSPDDARRNAINTICYHFFDCYLNRPKSHGLVLIDRFEDGRIDGHLREKFSVGVTGLPYADELRLNRIVGFHYSAIGQSNFGSVVDIILGSFRFAVNAYTRCERGKLSRAKFLLEKLSPLFFREGSMGLVPEISLFFSPKTVKLNVYRNQYEDLKTYLSNHGISARQSITD